MPANPVVDLSVMFVGRTPAQGAIRGLDVVTNPSLNATTGTFFDAYIPLPLSRQVTEDNEKWLYETSAKFTGLPVD